MKTTFNVTVRYLNETISRLMRAADLAGGMAVTTTYKCSVTWEAGVAVTQEKVDKAKDCIKEAMKRTGWVVLDIVEI